MAPLKGTWRRIANSDALKRSSQVISTTADDLIVFSGELEPRKPVDSKIYHVPLSTSSPETTGQVTVMNPPGAPSPRVGAACAAVKGKAYLFSGRGGEAMAPLEEEGRLCVFDQATLRWSSISPADNNAPYPEGRSYHAMTSDNERTLYLHAGCPSSGRLSDLWSFDLQSKHWTKLPDAPGPARGGASLAFSAGKLWRMNGFDGKTEQGFALDVFDLEAEEWSTRTWEPGHGPGARSVSALLPVWVGGREWLVTMFGEADPSSLGHMGAGKMLGDVWGYDVEGGKWEQMEAAGHVPAPRGWFAAGVLPGRRDRVVVQGGLGGDNERLGDAWVLELA